MTDRSLKTQSRNHGQYTRDFLERELHFDNAEPGAARRKPCTRPDNRPVSIGVVSRRPKSSCIDCGASLVFHSPQPYELVLGAQVRLQSRWIGAKICAEISTLVH